MSYRSKTVVSKKHNKSRHFYLTEITAFEKRRLLIENPQSGRFSAVIRQQTDKFCQIRILQMEIRPRILFIIMRLV